MFYAKSENAMGEKETLSHHLHRVSKLCEKFASDFHCEAYGALLGAVHDLGKASETFQDVLRHVKQGVNHAAAGAYVICGKPNASFLKKMLADIVYAHHSTLTYHSYPEYVQSLERHSYDLQGRCFSVQGQEGYQLLQAFLKKEYWIIELFHNLNLNPNHFPLETDTAVQRMLCYRMLYSCLIDADWSASAEHEDKLYLQRTSGGVLHAQELLEKLEQHLQQIRKSSVSNPKINEVRELLLKNCMQSAEKASGLFTLTAPTGSGKTLAMLAFALKHSLQKPKKKRIIFVLPFLSIIEQNASIYRKICGDVLEIHSQTAYPEQMREQAERWDAPIIVTTSVHFFEMLFQDKAGNCRGLHHIADSVILFDEAQTLPVNLIKPTIETVNTLCSSYGCSVVFSTATQPAFQQIEGVQWNPCEIVEDRELLYAKTKRTKVEMQLSENIDFSEIARQMAEKNSVCCIVNRKDHSLKLFQLLCSYDKNACFHISTDMCAFHRTEVIQEIRNRLQDGLPCRVVSTSCIEAGVDLDFQYMYRALAPLEAIVQSAGRCNRNGNGEGKLTVFVPAEEKQYPTDWYGIAAHQVKVLQSRHKIEIDCISHMEEYYQLLFSQGGITYPKLEQAIERMDFEEVSRRYHFIENNTVNILVPYSKQMDTYRKLKDEAITKGISASWIRSARGISVASYQREKVSEICEELFFKVKGHAVPSGWYVLHDTNFYNEKSGFHLEEDSELNSVF